LSRWARLLTHSYTRLALKPTNGFYHLWDRGKRLPDPVGSTVGKIHIAHNAIDTDEIIANHTHHVQEGDRLRRDLKFKGKKSP